MYIQCELAVCCGPVNSDLSCYRITHNTELRYYDTHLCLCPSVKSPHTIRTWTRFPVMEFHTFNVRLLAAVITVLSWRSHATMVTFSLVTLSSSGGGLYFLRGRAVMPFRTNWGLSSLVYTKKSDTESLPKVLAAASLQNSNFYLFPIKVHLHHITETWKKSSK